MTEASLPGAAAALFWLPRSQSYWADLLAVYDPLGPSMEALYKGTEGETHFEETLILWESPGGIEPLGRLFAHNMMNQHRLIFASHADSAYPHSAPKMPSGRGSRGTPKRRASDIPQNFVVYRPFWSPLPDHVPAREWQWKPFASAAQYRNALRPDITALYQLPAIPPLAYEPSGIAPR